MKSKTFLRLISKRFPKRLAESFDRVGLMTGKIPEDIKKILLCLDLDWEILPKVKQFHPS